MKKPLLYLLILLVTVFSTSCSQSSKETFEIGDKTFLLNGKPFVVKAAEIHYPRIPKEYWEHRIKMCKALGMNTICLYVFWNFHEPEEENMTLPVKRYCGFLSVGTGKRDVCDRSSRTVCLCRVGNGWIALVVIKEEGYQTS